MFRLTEYMHQLVNPTPVRHRSGNGPVKPVVIWNLTRRCNLKCRHCYTVSADVDFPDPGIPTTPTMRTQSLTTIGQHQD